MGGEYRGRPQLHLRRLVGIGLSGAGDRLCRGGLRAARRRARGPVEAEAMTQPLLRVDGLVTQFHSQADRPLTAVDGISFDVRPGEIFGLVGESGCGKSATCRSIIRLFGGSAARIAAGRIELDGKDMSALDRSEGQKSEIQYLIR